VTPLADIARRMFAAAVAAVEPAALIRRLTFTNEGVQFGEAQLFPPGKLLLIAAGKAGPGLATAVMHQSSRPPDRILVVAPNGTVSAPGWLADSTLLASHPVPDGTSAAAGGAVLAELAALGPEDGALVLLSGGASSLLATPLGDLAIADVASVTSSLLRSGAAIAELNTVRKHLLATAGGRLGAGCRAPMLAFVLSDVPGDDLAIVASGPTVADETTNRDALAVLDRYRLSDQFPAVAAALTAGAWPETPKPGDPGLAGARTFLLGSAADALDAAEAVATQAGFRTAVFTRRLRGEASAVGDALGHLALSCDPGEPRALLASGETTVRVRGGGCGGRNLEVALAAAAALAGSRERCLLAGGTDGVDGSSPAAGAVVDGDTLGRGILRGRDAAFALAENDSWGFFSGLPEAIVTGPTGTNVADVVFILVAGGEPLSFPVAHFDGPRLPVFPGPAGARRPGN
jgi:glycerate-2-kinase